MKNKITKHKKDKNVPHFEITEAKLVHSNFVNNSYEKKIKNSSK